MLRRFTNARADLTMMNTLLPAAEQIARDDGTDMAGAEHLLLAALDLPDGIARETLGTFGTSAPTLREATTALHQEALRRIGVIADDEAIGAVLPAADPPRGPYRAQGSLQTALLRAVELAKQDRSRVNSGYLLLAITEPEHGTIAGALRHLGVDRTVLRDEVRRRLNRST